MNKTKKWTTGEYIFCIIMITMLLFLMVSMVQYGLSFKTETIEGKVVDVELFDNYMAVTFEDGKTYNIGYRYEADTDFTVNSKVIVRLRYSEIWFWPNADNVWGIEQIIKYG